MTSTSIIVPSLNGAEYLLPCIDSLLAQSTPPTEIIVLDCSPDSAAARLPANPAIKIIRLDAALPVPKMRSLGIEMARGDLILLTEDHCAADCDWIASLLVLHSGFPEAIIGGPMDYNFHGDRLSWAAHFFEYAAFIPPLDPRKVCPISATNVGYPKALIGQHQSIFLSGRWDHFIHQELFEAGLPFHYDSKPVIHNRKSFTERSFRAQCYHFGRGYGGQRRLSLSSTKLLALRLMGFLLPVVKTIKISRIVLTEKRRYQSEFFQSLLWLVWFNVVWSWGEWIGYCFGKDPKRKDVE